MEDFPTTEVCPRDDIAAYVDGELSAEMSAALESHVAECGVCGRALLHQRQFLAALSASLGNEDEVPLPDDFTRKIITNAESSVSGLRRPGELFTAVFICAVLALIAILAVGPELSGVASALGGAGEKLLTFGSQLLRFGLNVVYVLAVVARTLGSHLAGAGSMGWLALIGVAAFLGSSVWVLKRRNA